MFLNNNKMGNKISYYCYCPICDKYIGAWWHYTWASSPIFLNFPCTQNPDGYPYCSKCHRRFGWFDLKRKFKRRW